jgi:hypothetical protein
MQRPGPHVSVNITQQLPLSNAKIPSVNGVARQRLMADWRVDESLRFRGARNLPAGQEKDYRKVSKIALTN